MKSIALHWQILIAIVLAVIAASLTGTSANIAGVTFYAVYEFLGGLFMNGLKMVIVPLVFASIVCGVAGIGGDSHNLSRLGGKTLGFYLISSILAILVGLLIVNLIEPGVVDGQPAGEILNLDNSVEVEAKLAKVEGRGLEDVVQIFSRMIPPNIVDAAANQQMLGLIFFAVLFGFFMTQIEAKSKSVLLNFWQAVFATMMKITMWVMKFAPIGVFGLVAKTVAATGFQSFYPLLSFFITVVLALAIHLLLVMPVILKLVAGVNPLRHFKAMSPALLTAFSTASSSSTLPLTMRCVEDKAKVSNKTASFVLPLGATINMDGTALYECVAAMFIAQAYGLELSFATQFLIVFTALITSIGVAGIPAASLVAITVILGVIGLPIEAIGLLLVTDRILDMMRTAVNVFSDSCCAVVVAKTEGEEQVLKD